ncbi:kinase-like domain-containing protein [Chlamydoabsidia padenii]|nr:kinase-like domain-containing protein [Chlamydoabsidia padenii]
MMRILGQGTFGRVIECYDRLRRDRCAIKVIRSIKKYRDASTIEIRILKTLHDHDRDNIYQCIELYEWFEYENHICMVFALMGPSLFDYLKSNRFKPFSLGQIQDFAIQLFTSVEFLHRLKLIHTDLKPENILLVNQPEKTNSSSKVLKNTDIRLIDFGSATFENEYHAEVVSTRHYRAPEIILDIGWSFPCDIWSIGCMLVEFLTGEPLFQTHDDLEHLAMMEAVLGKIPFTMIYQSLPNGLVFFDRRNQLRYPSPSTSVKNLKYVQSLGTLPYIIPTSLSKGHTLLLDLLEKILVLDPKSRLTATEALQHPFMKYTL